MKLLFYKNTSLLGGVATTKRVRYIRQALESEGFIVDDVVGGHKLIPEYKNKVSLIIHKITTLIFKPFSMAIYASKIAKTYDAVFFDDISGLELVSVAIPIHIKGSKVVIELNENPYAPIRGSMNPVWIRKLRRIFMLMVGFKFVDGFICISEPLKILAKKYSKKKSIIINVPILCDFFEKPPKPFLEYPYILNSGTISDEKDGIIAVFKAFALAVARINVDLKLVLTVPVSDPSLNKKLSAIVSNNKIDDRIIWTDYLCDKDIVHYQAYASMAIINKRSNWQNNYCFPTKMGELMIMNVPLIMTKVGEMGKYVSDKNVIIVEPDNVEQIAEAIINIINNPDNAKLRAEAGFKVAKENFYYLNYAKPLKMFFDSVIHI